MLLILSCLTSCPGDSVESSTRLIHHVIRLMHALLILRASMRVRTHRDGNVHGGRTKFFPIEASTHPPSRFSRRDFSLRVLEKRCLCVASRLSGDNQITQVDVGGGVIAGEHAFSDASQTLFSSMMAGTLRFRERSPKKCRGFVSGVVAAMDLIRPDGSPAFIGSHNQPGDEPL